MKDLEVRDPVPPTKRVHKLVLTGGPCGGKTTAQNRLATFFESLGWRVFRVPETATILLNGGVRHCVRLPGRGASANISLL